MEHKIKQVIRIQGCCGRNKLLIDLPHLRAQAAAEIGISRRAGQVAYQRRIVLQRADHHIRMSQQITHLLRPYLRLQGQDDLREHHLFQAVQHLVQIREVAVKGTAVDMGRVCNILDRDFINGRRLIDRPEGVKDRLSGGIRDFRLFLHGVPPKFCDTSAAIVA